MIGLAFAYSAEVQSWLTFYVFMLFGVKFILEWKFIGRIKLRKNVLIALQVISFIQIWLSFKTYVGYDVGIHFVLLATVFKFVESNSQRDYKILFLFILFSTAALTILNTEVLHLSFLLALSTVVLTLIYETSKGKGLQISMGGFKSVILYLVYCIPIILALFIVFPRVQGHLPGFSKTQSHTGFSADVDFQQMGELLTNTTPVLRYWDYATIKSEVYLRGKILQWHANQWIGIDTRKQEARSLKEQHHLSFKIILEPTFGKYLFVPAGTKEAYRLSQLKNRLYLYKTSEMISQRAITQKIVYGGRIDKPLYVPSSKIEKIFVGSRLSSWLKEYRELSTQNYLKQMKIYFRKNFTYTLNPGPMEKEGFLDEFLFEKKAGFCLHFATALTHLLHLKNIPAHLVLGYAGGEYNRFGNYFLVRESNAHAWVEAWINNSWQRIDPTVWVAPGLLIKENQRSEGYFSFLKSVRRYFDERGTSINLWLLNFDFEKQKRWIKEQLRITVRWYELFGAFLMVLSFIVLIVWAVRSLVKQKKRSNYYKLDQKILLKLFKRGYDVRSGSMFSYWKESCVKKDSLVSEYLWFYLTVRYGENSQNLNKIKIPF